MKQNQKKRFLNFNRCYQLPLIFSVWILTGTFVSAQQGTDHWSNSNRSNTGAPSVDPNWQGFEDDIDQRHRPSPPGSFPDYQFDDGATQTRVSTQQFDPDLPSDLTIPVPDGDLQAPTTVVGMVQDTWVRLRGMLSSAGGGEWFSSFKQKMGSPNFTKMFGSLAVVLGVYFGFVWLTRKLNGAKGNGRLPKEVVELMGAAPFGPRQNLQLVRLGSKLLLLLNGPDGTSSIGEITEPNEVEYLSNLCSGKKTEPNSGVATMVSRIVSGSKAKTRTEPESLDVSQLVQALQNASRNNSANVFEA